MKRRTSLKLIERAISEKWIKPLALFHSLKFKYNNSCIYDYRGRFGAISLELGLSMKSMYNYIKILRSKGLIFDHSKNLILKSFKVIRFEFGGLWKKCTLTISKENNLFDIECLLYLKVLEDHAKKQAFKEALRQFGREDQRIRGLYETPFHVSLSYRTIAKILNLSNNKVVAVIKNLNRLNFVHSEKQKPVLIVRNASRYDIDNLCDFPGRRFILAGDLFEQYGMKHEFIHFPVLLKRVTLRQYIKFRHNIL